MANDNDMRRAQDAATSLTTEQLILALAYQAASSTNDMINDFLRDPNYLRSEGIPSAESIREQALDMATITMPMALSESGVFGDGYKQQEGEKFFDFALRIAIDEVYQAKPQFYDVRISALNVAKTTKIGDNGPTA